MPLRLMQIFVPDQGNGEIEQLLEGRDVLGTWRDATSEDRVVLHLLVPAEETEPIMDRFEQAYGGTDGFHVVLFPVEAVLPRVGEDPPEEASDQPPAGEGQSNGNGAGRISREELYGDIGETLGLSRVFLAMTALSAVVAAAGLMRDDVAVVIGAMVIAPLLGPNVAMALSCTLGDVHLLRRALVTNLVGVTLTLAISVAIGAVMNFDPEVQAIADRTQLGASDLALALAAGAAGTFAFTAGLAGPVIGVMVAVALVPPTVTFGMLLGAGLLWPALGALSLVTANVVCINLAGVATFLAQGVRPRTWYEEERARHATRLAIAAWCLLLVALAVIVYVSDTGATFAE